MHQWYPSVLIRLAGVALALLAATGGKAQNLLAPAVSWPGLTEDDIVRMHEAATRLYEGRSIGTVERWRSPESKDAGEVRLLNSFDTNGMPCRTIESTIRFDARRDSPNRYVITWCRVSDGSWKIVELPRRR